MADEFVAGNKVVISDDGPVMKIESVGDNYGVPSAWCVWVVRGKVMRDVFALAVLQKVKPLTYS